jgi:molybdate transport system ATP-binding protein
MSPPPARPVIALDGVTLARLGGDAVLRGITWHVHEGETWAVVGPVASGKTTLAEALAGRHRVVAGSLAWPLLDRLRAAGRHVARPADSVVLVSFREESWCFSYARHYYQQRFNFVEPHDDLTLDAFLRTGTAASASEAAAVATRLGVEGLRALSLIKLSNGQTRRARIARALLSRAELLILDDPFMGLDVAGRADLADLLGGLVREGLHLVLVTRPGEVPAWVTHVLLLGEGTTRWRGPRAEYRPPGLQRSEVGGQRSEVRGQRSEVGSQRSERGMEVSRDAGGGEPVVEMRDVSVVYGKRRVLRGVSWTVRAGERWAVLGPNGAGKTVLLSLICGDHPQAYSNDVRLFGRRRGTGETIWEVKHRIGLVSPELHLYFSEPLTAARTAATGFFDVLVSRPTTPAHDARVRELFEQFGIAGLADRPFARLSTGEQRLVLLIRALVKDPPLLVLDEPFQGLDDRLVRRARDWLDDRLRPEQALLFVSHHEEEVPRTVGRRLRLEEGRVVETT